MTDIFVEMTTLAEPPGDPITVVRIHYVQQGCEARFETEFNRYLQEFTAIPGNLGLFIFRPGKYHDGVYRVVYKFASRTELDRWHTSPTYLEWIETEKKLTIAPPATKEITGLETWFTLPGQNVVKPPTKVRQAVVTWFAVLPVSIFISLATGPFLDDAPFLIQKMVFVTLLVSLLTWVVMPVVSRIAAPFLYPPEDRGSDGESVMDAP